jgi:hypothetical protein
MGIPSIATGGFGKGQIGDFTGKPGKFCGEPLNLCVQYVDSIFVSFENRQISAHHRHQ